MLDRSFIEKIEAMSEVREHFINGHTYTTKQLHRVAELTPTPLTVNTLESFASLVELETSDNAEKTIIHIVDNKTVECYSQLTGENSRHNYFTATADLPSFPFGRYMPIEEMITNLKSKFKPTQDREDLISIISSITDEQSLNIKDDGITQVATVRKGISMQQNTAIKPIITLKPYRTFVNLEQPESDFLIRLKDGQAALFEADGGAWKYDAMLSISERLMELFESNDNVLITN